MPQILSVRLHGKEIGHLQLINVKMRFAYRQDIAQAISLCLPLPDSSGNKGRYFNHKVCQAYFGGLLPESDQLRKQLAMTFKISEHNDFGLLANIGRDCAGALSFHGVDEPEQIVDLEQGIELRGRILPPTELKQMLENLPRRPFLGQRISLAGAQEKAAVCLIDQQIALPDMDVPTTHIIKTAIPQYPESLHNEFICMKAAQALNLEVAEVQLRMVEGLEILLITRFDRQIISSSSNGKKKIGIRRILQEDFTQSLGIPAMHKYDVTFKNCWSVLNQTESPAEDKRKFMAQVIFNYFIGNTDAHGKNFSIFMEPEFPMRLTPAYDLLSTIVYQDHNLDPRLAMKIGQAKLYDEVTQDDWVSLAQEADLNPSFVWQELKRQRENIIPVFTSLMQQYPWPITHRILANIEARVARTNFLDKL